MKTIDRLYDRWLKEISKWCLPGITFEVGSGQGQFRDYLPNCITSDKVFNQSLSMCCDAIFIPIKSSKLSNVVAFDVIHHLHGHQLDRTFYANCLETLRPKGRMIICEPYLGWFSRRYVYNHHIEKDQDMFQIVARRCARGWDNYTPLNRFRCIENKKLAGLVYASTGGRTHKQTLPDWFLNKILWLDKLTPITRKLWVYEKR